MKYEPEARGWADCAYADCTKKAIVRKRLKGSSYTDLCIEHYDLQKLDEALKWNHDHGLDNLEKRKTYVYSHSKGLITPPNEVRSEDLPNHSGKV